MITPAYSISATERVLPRMALDFTTASLDSRVTFTRTTNSTNPATYINSLGVVTQSTNNQPRFDYNPISLACAGLLIEESRENSYTYSSDYTQAAWNKNNITATLASVTAPDGTLTGVKIAPTAAGICTFSRALAGGAAAGNSISIFAKKGSGAITGSTFILRNTTTSTNLLVVNVNYDTGVITYVTGSSGASMTAYPNGWWRVVLSVSTGVSAGNTLTGYFGFSSFNAIGTEYVYFWGGQFEAGAFATSYIPTTTAALTRNADVAVMTGTNFSDWWKATTGSVTASALPSTVSGTRPTVQFDDTTANNFIVLRNNTTDPELYVKATTDQAQIDAGTIVANTSYKLSGAWNTNNCAAAINGAAAVTDTSATIPTVTQARLGCDGTNYFNGRLQTIRYWPQRLIDAEVQAFSK